MARLVALIFLVVVIGFFWIFYGTPVHDFRLSILERQFTQAHINHPSDSVFLARRSFLGGPSPHGSAQCVYATGEVRHAMLDKSDIQNAYRDSSVGKQPLKIYFTDESELPYEIPFGEWQEELGDVNTGTVYIVYITTSNHYLGDLRCDN